MPPAIPIGDAIVKTFRRAEIMERASSDFFEALRHVSVDELKALRPNTPRFVTLIDTLIVVRTLMRE